MPVEAPTQITPTSLADYLDVLTKAVFQSGISWKVVEAKWAGMREAFGGFEPEHVADLTPVEIDELAQDTRLIRNRRKIEATSRNAATMLELADEHGSFEKYLRSFPTYDGLQSDLVGRFKFLGNTGTYYFLYVVKEPVPPWEEWTATYGVPGQRSERKSRSRA
ncbi:MAG: DNA-3-methyladenine glycosylase I [Actinomycetota bacterium]